MTRVLIALDGSDLDHHVATSTQGLFGNDADLWAVNVQSDYRSAPSVGHSAPLPILPILPVPYGQAYPYMLPELYGIRSDPPTDDPGTESAADVAIRRGESTARAVLDDAGLGAGVPVGEIGDPATAILTAAHHHHADVVVVGMHQRGWWSRLFQPSVSKEVLEHSQVPILVVPEPSGDEPTSEQES